MGNRKFSVECFKVDNPIDKVIVNKCYNCNLSVGDLYFQVNIADSDTFNSSVTCYTFSSFKEAVAFLYINNIL